MFRKLQSQSQKLKVTCAIWSGDCYGKIDQILILGGIITMLKNMKLYPEANAPF
jgi:hypothetical protein